MPRQARLDAPGTLHHVMGRGIEGSEMCIRDRHNPELHITYPFAGKDRRPTTFGEYEEASYRICDQL